jgi:hypothetical protein
MNSGQGLEDCLRLYPEFAEELEPCLKTVVRLHAQSAFIPSQAAKARGRERLYRAMAEIEQKQQETRLNLLQRLLRQPRVWVPIAAALALVLIGYGLWPLFTPTTTPVAYAGILEVRVTDAPTHDVSAINVTVGDIEVCKAGSETGWITVIKEDKSFDLLKLRGVEEVLGSNKVDVGHYTQIRMDVKNVTVTIDGEPQKAVLPSGKLKLLGSFKVEKDETTVLTLDFDADKSVKIAKVGTGKVIFKPVVKLVITEPEAPSPSSSGAEPEQ